MELPALTPNRTFDVPAVGVDNEPSEAMRKRSEPPEEPVENFITPELESEVIEWLN